MWDSGDLAGSLFETVWEQFLEEIGLEWTPLRNRKDFGREKETRLKLGKLQQQYGSGNTRSGQFQEENGCSSSPNWKGQGANGPARSRGPNTGLFLPSFSSDEYSTSFPRKAALETSNSSLHSPSGERVTFLPVIPEMSQGGLPLRLPGLANKNTECSIQSAFQNLK